MNEQTVLHRIYRECIDAVNDVWRKVSFWSQASDIDLTQGETVQFRLDNLDLDSTNAKTLIENFIYDANEAHRYLQLQLDQLRDNLQSRMTTLRSRFENWRIVVGDDPALIRAYEQRLEEAERDIAALIKAVQDEVDRIQGILDGILDAASNDPLAKDILDKITALRNKTNNDNSSIRDDCIGPGFNPDVQAIAPDITQAILAQDKKIYTTGSKFWQYYYFKNDHVESSEDLYNLETVGYGDVIDLPYGSQVNIDYNSKLDICFVRGWLVLDSYDFNKTDIGELNLANIFPKDSTIAFTPEYMDVTFSNGFTVKVNSMIGSKKVVFAPRNGDEGYSIRWEGNYSNDSQGRAMSAYVNGDSEDFGDIIDPELGGTSGSFESIWIMFRGSYYDRGAGESQQEEDPAVKPFASISNFSPDVTGLLTGFNDYFVIPKANVTYPITLSNHSNSSNTAWALSEPVYYLPTLVWIYADQNNPYVPVKGSNGDAFTIVLNKGENDERRINVHFSLGEYSNNIAFLEGGLGLSSLLWCPSPTSTLSYFEALSDCLALRNNSYINFSSTDLRLPLNGMGNYSSMVRNSSDSTALYRPDFNGDELSTGSTPLQHVPYLKSDEALPANMSTITIEWPDTMSIGPESFIMGVAFCLIATPETLYGAFQGATLTSIFYYHNNTIYFPVQASSVSENSTVTLHKKHPQASTYQPSDIVGVATPYIRGAVSGDNYVDLYQPQSDQLIYQITVDSIQSSYYYTVS